MLKKLLILILLVAVVAGFFAYQKYNEIFAPNVPQQLANEYLIIPTHSSYEEVVHLLQSQNFIIDTTSFNWLAQKMKYKRPTMRAGRYKIQAGWNNHQLIKHLRGGKQATVKVVINNERLPEEIAGKVAKVIEADSADIMRLFNDERYISEQGFNKETLMSLFIPNTYDFFWNQNAKEFFKRMQKEHKAFWNKNRRLEKAKDLDMSPKEVYTLASIVGRETNKNDEKPRIAGVYLNRLKRGIALQADPTVVFAVKQFDLRRVLNKHLEFESPYNTYLHPGLPPGPISIASISSIDAVLNAEDHNYLYFCAKPDGGGYHAFAKTLSAHNVNANKFHRWLNKQKIR